MFIDAPPLTHASPWWYRASVAAAPDAALHGGFDMRPTACRIVVATLLTFVNASPAAACFETDTTPRPWVWFTGTNTAYIAIEGLVVKSGGVGVGDYCAAAIGHSGTVITGVSGLQILDDADPDGGPLPITNLPFGANATTNADLAAAEPGLTWHGFHSTVGGAVAQGTAVALVFDVTVAPASTYQDIMDELQGEAVVGFDDATITGSLAGTLEQDPIIGAAELPYCYDDVVQSPGEICDGASNLGCPGTDSCVDCSVCLVGNPANRCKADILRSLAYVERSQLKCWSAGAKVGTGPPVGCIPSVITAQALWLKYVPSCPQTLPADPTVQVWLDSLGADLAPLIPLGDDTPAGEFKCASQKFKAASFRAVGAAKCYSKAYKLNTVVDPLCLSKVDTKYQSKFAKAELPGLCDPLNVGNATPVANRADQFVTDMLLGIPPP